MKEVKDDWLEKELEREKRVSAWDLDEARKVKTFHEDHCAADAVRQVHKVEHSSGQMVRNSDVARKIITVYMIFFFIFVFAFIGFVMFNIFVF